MSLTKWAVGILVFDLFMIILLTGMGTKIASDYNNELTQNPEYDTDDVIDIDDLGFFDKISWSISGLPWYIDAVLLIPNLIAGIIFAMYLRGVN